MVGLYRLDIHVILLVGRQPRYRHPLQRPGIGGRGRAGHPYQTRPHLRVVGVNGAVGVSHVVFGSPVVDVIRVRGRPLRRAGGAVIVDNLEILDTLGGRIGRVPYDRARVHVDMVADPVVTQYGDRIPVQRQVYGASHRVA